MRKIAVVLLAGILLCLGGCAKEPVISGIPVAERLYSVYNGSATKIVDGTGKVVLQGEYPNTTLIRDELTKEPLYIVMVKINAGAERNEYGEPVGYAYTQALYDANGKLLYDYGEASYRAAFGDYLLIYSNSADGRLVNMKTGQTAYEGVMYLMSGNGCVMILTRSDNTLVVMDGQGRVLGQKKDILNAYFSSPPQDSADIIAMNTNYRYGLMDAACQSVLEFDYDQINQVMGNYAVVEKDGVFQAVDLTTKQVVLARPERISYFDGSMALLSKWEDQKWVQWMIDPAGNAVSKEYDSIAYTFFDEGEDAFPNTFIAREDENTKNGDAGGATVAVLDRKGQVIFSKHCESGEGLWIEPLGNNRYIVSTYRNGQSSANIVNEKGEETLPAKYAYFYPAYGENGERSSYLWGSFFTAQRVMLMDLLDENGKVIIENIKNDAQYFCDGARVIGTQGFSVGMMDLTGKWLYKEKVFNGLDRD